MLLCSSAICRGDRSGIDCVCSCRPWGRSCLRTKRQRLGRGYSGFGLNYRRTLLYRIFDLSSIRMRIGYGHFACGITLRCRNARQTYRWYRLERVFGEARYYMRARRLRIREIDFERIIRRISIRTFYIRKYKRIHSINSSFCIRFFLACNSNILSLTISDSEGNSCGIVFRAAALIGNSNTL